MGKAEKPWGHIEILWEGRNYVVKKLVLKDETSTHYHKERSELLLIPIEGSGIIILNDKPIPLQPFSAVAVSKGSIHKIVPNSQLEIIEITDSKLEDVVRVADKYGRV